MPFRSRQDSHGHPDADHDRRRRSDESNYRILHGRPMSYPTNEEHRPSTESLDLHRRLAVSPALAGLFVPSACEDCRPQHPRMQMNRDEFLRWPHKAITLLGMSGVGKTHAGESAAEDQLVPLLRRLPNRHEVPRGTDPRQYQAPGDASGILRDLLRSDSIYIASNITVHNLEPISTFLGKMGRAELVVCRSTNSNVGSACTAKRRRAP